MLAPLLAQVPQTDGEVVVELTGVLQPPRQVVVLEGPWSSLPSPAPTTPG
jgi:hypothetical protein